MIKDVSTKFDVNDIVKTQSIHDTYTGIIVSKRVMKLPFNMKKLILYCVKKSDNHVEWINEKYLVKLN